MATSTNETTTYLVTTTTPQTLRLSSGQRLSYAEYGAGDGMPVVYCHGFPSSRLEAALLDDAAQARGLRVIAPDRPGIGCSDYVRGRRLRDWPQTVGELTAHLGLKRYHLLAVSGGGPYACACAHTPPAGLDRVGIVCGLAPFDLPGVVSAFNPAMQFYIRCTRLSPAAGALLFRVSMGTFVRLFPRLLMRLYTWRAEQADRDSIATKTDREIFAGATHEAFRQGTRGPARDLVVYAGDWGFDLAEIETEVQLWHGEADVTVPAVCSREAYKRMPASTLKLYPNEGHFSLPLRHMPEILAAF